MSYRLQKPKFTCDKMIRLNVYRMSSDCTNNGISSKEDYLYAFTTIEQAKTYMDINPSLTDKIVFIDGTYETLRAFPVNQYLEGRWQMFGGNIALICSNTNFVHTLEPYYNHAIKIMDRIEN